jgi:putative oxygen-independent coproporphyrinogen III oxidase
MPSALSGAGLYLHVPFCSAICPYCDFAVQTGGRERRAGFVDSLAAEMALWRQDDAGSDSDGEAGSNSDSNSGNAPDSDAGAGGRPRWGTFDTVYFGGGTPSALAGDQIERLLAASRQALPIADDAWVALEANPEDVTEQALRRWQGLGIAMLSLGVQSFDAATLRFLGRRHDPAQARRAVEMALAAGFPIVSVDLMYGSPNTAKAGRSPVQGQAGQLRRDMPRTWRRDLETVVALAPQHLSCYQLTIHSGTAFGTRAARGDLAELPEDEQAELFRFTHTFLGDHGYTGYEVSNFASAPGHESRHNRKYWDHTPYLGLGPSAHSFDGQRRWWNERQLSPYQASIAAGQRPVAGQENLTPADLALEELMLALRTAAGLDLAGFLRRHGLDIAASNRQLLDDLAARGLATQRAGRLLPSLNGLAVADSLARAFDLTAPSQPSPDNP